MSTKRPFQPKKGKRNKTHGFRQRMKTSKGRKTLRRRMVKGRTRISS